MTTALTWRRLGYLLVVGGMLTISGGITSHGQVGVADLSISKTDSPDPVTAAATVSYSITVSNAGPDAANGVTVTDTLPAGVTFVSASGSTWSCGESSGVVTCNLTPSLGSPASASAITIEVNAPNEGGTITNSASVTSAEGDPDTTNNSVSATTTVNPSADLSITKSDSPDPVAVGGALSYTLTVTNSGPSSVPSVTVTDTLPAAVTFVSASGTDWSCLEAGGVVTCDRSISLAVVSAPPITIDVTAPSTAGTISNTATVSSSTSDPNSANDSDTETTAVTTSADLSITKTDSPDPVTAGEDLTYTLTVDNAGPSDASGVVVSDPIPPGTSFVSASGGGTHDPLTDTVTWALGALAVGDPPVTLTLVVHVDPDRTAAISNTATVSSSTSDPDSANDSDTETTAVTTSADLSITKTDSPDPVVAGTDLTYTIVVSNAGPSDAASVVVTDPVPDGTSFVSATGGGTHDSFTNTVTWSLGTLGAGGAPVAVEFVVRVSPARTTPISNTATVSSATSDPDSANNSSIEPTVVLAEADLAVSKSDSPDPVVAGQQITYTVTAQNLGPSNASNVEIIDTLPDETTIVSMSGDCIDNAGGMVTCGPLDLVAGASASWEIVVVVEKVGSAVQDGTVLTNGAGVTSDTPDPNSANDEVGEETTVSAPNISLVKSAVPESGSEVSPGELIVFTITYTNSGSAAATGFVITDTVDALLGEVTPSAGGLFDPDTRVITWTFTDPIGPAGSPTSTGAVSFTGRLGSITATRTIRNQASATVTEYQEPVESNTTSTTARPPDVLVTKDADRPDNSEVKPFDVITYQLTIRNRGGGSAIGVVVTDDPPLHLTYVTGSTRVDGSPVADAAGTSPLFGSGIALGTLDPGDDSLVTFQMAVDVSAPAGALLENWGYATWNLGTQTSGDFVDLRVLRPRTGPVLRQSILVQGPTGRTILVTVVSELVELLPITGYQAVLLGLLGLSALGFGRASTMRIARDLFGTERR